MPVRLVESINEAVNDTRVSGSTVSRLIKRIAEGTSPHSLVQFEGQSTQHSPIIESLVLVAAFTMLAVGSQACCKRRVVVEQSFTEAWVQLRRHPLSSIGG